MSGSDISGFIFDIQHYSIHDGPGIRTTVFLSGCPLRCLWCQNPESHAMAPQLLFRSEKCTGCGLCISVCPEKAVALAEDGIRTDRYRCSGCGACVSVCTAGARSISGREVSALEVFEDVASDKVFYEGSGGGVTLSGGETLLQPEFSRALLRLCRENGISTAVETCGAAPWDRVKELLSETDLVLYDLKHMNPQEHTSGTGVSNKIILDNLRKIHGELGLSVQIRIPVIPGYNDSEENLRSTAVFVAEQLDRNTPVCLLPYHRMGTGKWVQLEKTEPAFTAETPGEEQMRSYQKIFEYYGLTATVGS